MHVPQFLPYIGNEEYKAIESCFDQNWITEGPKAKVFSEMLLHLTGARYGVFAPNGTLALFLALKAAGIGNGDQVIVPDFTFIGTANAVEMTGATPVFAEVNNHNFQVKLESVKKLINEKTRAIMPVHIYGTAVNMEELTAFARTENLLVIEDAAQAIGIKFNGKHAGSFGEAGCFSFFADKTITTGEGGFIITHDEKIYNRLLFLRNQGRKDRGTFIHPEIGYNFRMTDIQCAIGIKQLEKIEEIAAMKSGILARYRESLAAVEEVRFFTPESGANYIPFRVGILCERAHSLIAFMQEAGIEPRTFFYPLHRQPCYAVLSKQQGAGDEQFPNAIYAYENGICLPTYPTLGENQIQHVCETIKSFYAKQ